MVARSATGRGSLFQFRRQIVELVIVNGSVPVLSTKADNVEGGNRIKI